MHYSEKSNLNNTVCTWVWLMSAML